MNKTYIYVNKDEEIGDVIEKIRGIKSKEIILVVPEDSKSFYKAINLEILKKEIEDLKKDVVINTDDSKIENLARQYGFDIFLEDKEEKIFDVVPPKVYDYSQKIKTEEKNDLETEPTSSYKVAEQEEEINKKYKKTSARQPKKQTNSSFLNFVKKSLSSIIIFTLIGGFVFLIWQFFQAKAEISINIQKTPFEFNEVIILKTDQISPDFKGKILPARYISFNLNKTETITTTGQVFESTFPSLKVKFLNYLDYDFPLIAGTRVVYQNNVFRLSQRIVLPKKENNKPGEVEAEAIASEIKNNQLEIQEGSDLSIPGLEGKRNESEQLLTDFIKAKSSKSYTVSQSFQIRSVAPDDISNVKERLKKSLENSILTKLSLSYPDSFYIFDPLFAKIEIKNVSHNIGDKTDFISANGEAFYETLVVNKKDFDNFIRDIINEEILKSSKKLSIYELTLDKKEILDFDIKKKTMSLAVSGKAVLIPDLNIEKIKADLAGKRIDLIKSYFANIGGINSVSIEILPSWKKELPTDYRKIIIHSIVK
jgi:hypothetical protein